MDNQRVISGIFSLFGQTCQFFSQREITTTGFESSQIFNLHLFASGIFGYLLNEKTTCIFDNFSFMNRNTEISCCFKGKLTLSSLRRLENQIMVLQIVQYIVLF